MNKWNPVKDCDSYSDFLEAIRSGYATDAAFESREQKWSYGDLYDLTCRCLTFFMKFRRTLFSVSVKQPVLFAAAYFAIVLSDNVAVLLTDQEFSALTGESCKQITDVQMAELIRLPASAPANRGDPDGMCTLVGSSGTTSQKKCVMLSQRNILTSVINGMRIFQFSPGDRCFHVLPFSHMFGIVGDLLAPLYSGGTICFSDNHLRFFEDLNYFKPTHLNLPPILVDKLCYVLQKTGDYDFTVGGRLERILCSGARMNEKVNSILSEFGVRAYSAYGLTECAPCVSMSGERFYREGSVGVIIPCCKARFVNGELAVAGPNVMLGYYKDAGATEQVIRDGWLYTGDLGHLDQDGFLFLTGRKTNLIVFENGEKLEPEALEDRINTLPSVKESLVCPVSVKGRTKIRITVVCQRLDAEDSMLREGIHGILRQFQVRELCQTLELTETPLCRNFLGKVVRKNCSSI